MDLKVSPKFTFGDRVVFFVGHECSLYVGFIRTIDIHGQLFEDMEDVYVDSYSITNEIDGIEFKNIKQNDIYHFDDIEAAITYRSLAYK